MRIHIAVQKSRLHACVCVFVCDGSFVPAFDLCFIRGPRKMLLRWKTCHGAHKLHGEGVCVCVCLCVLYVCMSKFLCHNASFRTPTVCVCERAALQ